MLAVHRAANAVLDLQLAKMRFHVAHLQNTLGDAADLDYIGEGCLDVPERLLITRIIALNFMSRAQNSKGMLLYYSVCIKNIDSAPKTEIN